MSQTLKEKKGLLRAWIFKDSGAGVRGGREGGRERVVVNGVMQGQKNCSKYIHYTIYMYTSSIYIKRSLVTKVYLLLVVVLLLLLAVCICVGNK